MDTILGILSGEIYSGIHALADLSVCVKYTNKLSSAVVFSFHYGFHSYLSICCTYERVPKANKILRAYPNTWL